MLLTKAPPFSTTLVENAVVRIVMNVDTGVILVDPVMNVAIDVDDDIVIEEIDYLDNSIEDDLVYHIDNIFYYLSQNVLLVLDKSFGYDNDQMI
jgi:hypothetical protein